MRDQRRNLWLVGALAIFAVLLAIAARQLPSFIAFRRIESAEWMRTATSDERRTNAHRALGLWFTDPHDAFLVLLDSGDASSIPFLRAALSKQPSGDESCTWAHGRQALSRLESK